MNDVSDATPDDLPVASATRSGSRLGRLLFLLLLGMAIGSIPLSFWHMGRQVGTLSPGAVVGDWQPWIIVVQTAVLSAIEIGVGMWTAAPRPAVWRRLGLVVLVVFGTALLMTLSMSMFFWAARSAADSAGAWTFESIGIEPGWWRLVGMGAVLTATSGVNVGVAWCLSRLFLIYGARREQATLTGLFVLFIVVGMLISAIKTTHPIEARLAWVKEPEVLELVARYMATIGMPLAMTVFLYWRRWWTDLLAVVGSLAATAPSIYVRLRNRPTTLEWLIEPAITVAVIYVVLRFAIELGLLDWGRPRVSPRVKADAIPEAPPPAA